MIKDATIKLTVQDVSGQKRASVRGPTEASVQDLISCCLSRMKLPINDVENRPLSYRAFRLYKDRDGAGGEHLNSTDRVADVLREEDTIVLQPNIDAGAGRYNG